MEETFRYSIKGRVRLFTDGDEVLGVRTLWDIASEQFRDKFASTTASDLTACDIKQQVIQETDYEVLMGELGSDLSCVPFINAPWNGEIPVSRDEMIDHISGDMTLYNKELITRGSKLATGLLMQAIIKGDTVFSEFPRSVLPFSAHNPSHVAKFTEEEIPCLLWDPQTVETIAEAFTYSAYHGKLRNASLEAACTTYFPIAITRVWDRTPCTKINQAFVTVAFPNTMDIPETWCRGILLYHKVHMLFEQWLRGFTTEKGEPLQIENNSQQAKLRNTQYAIRNECSNGTEICCSLFCVRKPQETCSLPFQGCCEIFVSFTRALRACSARRCHSAHARHC